MYRHTRWGQYINIKPNVETNCKHHSFYILSVPLFQMCVWQAVAAVYVWCLFPACVFLERNVLYQLPMLCVCLETLTVTDTLLMHCCLPVLCTSAVAFCVHVYYNSHHTYTYSYTHIFISVFMDNQQHTFFLKLVGVGACDTTRFYYILHYSVWGSSHNKKWM